MRLVGATQWVAEQLVRLRVASAGQLVELASRQPDGPSRTAIIMALRHLSGLSGAPPLVVSVPAGGREVGYVVTEAGRAVIAGDCDWSDIDEDSHAPGVGVHEQWVADVGVLWEAVGHVITEYEIAPEDNRARPDLLALDRGAWWAVEVERTVKGSEAGVPRYVVLARAYAANNVAAPHVAPCGVWYLANSANERYRRRIAEGVVRGVFDAVTVDDGHDLLVVVDPVDLDRIAALRFQDRKRRIRALIDGVRPIFAAAAGVPDVDMSSRYVVPSRSEGPPQQVTRRSVVLVGRLEERTGTRGLVRCRDGLWQVRGIPADMAVDVAAGMRVAVFGVAGADGVLMVERMRAVGVDFEASRQQMQARRAREATEAEWEERQF